MEFLDKIESIVKPIIIDVGKFILRRWGDVGKITYKDERDFTTEVDRVVERRIIETLKRKFPAHGFIGEEFPPINSKSEYLWYIDPIDGTKYFANQGHLFTTSIGLVHKGKPVFGAIYIPISKQLFTAKKDKGAFLNGEKLTGSDVNNLNEAIVSIDTPDIRKIKGREKVWIEKKLTSLVRQVYRVRMLGVGSLSACFLATGAFDAYLDLSGRERLQDIAAGLILMKESGARVEKVKVGFKKPRILAANPKLFLKISKILTSKV